MTDNIKYFEDTLLSDRILDALYDMHLIHALQFRQHVLIL